MEEGSCEAMIRSYRQLVTLSWLTSIGHVPEHHLREDPNLQVDHMR